MTRALVVPADHDLAPYVQEVNTEDPRTMQTLVGGYIEAVTLPGYSARMYVNEDGLRLQMRPNHIASLLATHGIVGTAVVVGTGAEPNDAPVPEELLDVLRSNGVIE